MDYNNINPELITDLEELWNLVVAQRNFLNKKTKTNQLTEDIEYLNSRLENIKNKKKY